MEDMKLNSSAENTSPYYDGTKLLSMKDLDGITPEVYMVTSNRNAGKTTYFRRWFVNRFLKYGEKFVVLYRFNYQLSDVGNKFFRNIDDLFFPSRKMFSKPMAKGKYHELFLTDRYDKEIPKSCGYALAMNDSDSIRDLSGLFSDATKILFDEFQSETYHYCPKEIIQFFSVHTSLARGGGKQVKYMPVYMLSNDVTLLNPYYTAMGISSRLQEDTKYLRGHGFVLEQCFNRSASELLKQSRFNLAFPNNDYIAYAAENVYLHDNMNFIERLDGRSMYIATLLYNGKQFALRQYAYASVVYCDTRVDASYKYKVAVTAKDHTVDSMLLSATDAFIVNLRLIFKQGGFRFYDLESKEAVMVLLSY